MTLASVHAAKDSNGAACALLDFQEDLFPHARCVGEAGLEEERRLAYVAMTRAREELLLTWARHGRGARRASRFAMQAGLAA